MLKKFTLIFALFILSSNFANAWQVTGYNLKKGEVFTFKSDVDQTITQNMMGQQMEIKQAIGTTEKLEVLEVKDGIYTLSSTNLSTTQTISSPQGTQTMSSEGTSPFDKPMQILKGKTYTFTMNSSGKVFDVMGTDNIRAAIEKEIEGTPLASNIEQFMESFSKENLISTIEMKLNIYPTEDVEQWTKNSNVTLNSMPVVMDSEFLYASDIQILVNSQLSISGKGAFNGMQLDMDLTGTQEGTYNLNSETGMSEEFETTSNLEGSVGAQGMTIPMSILSVTKTIITKE